jgi:hypothetical protein
VVLALDFLRGLAGAEFFDFFGDGGRGAIKNLAVPIRIVMTFPGVSSIGSSLTAQSFASHPLHTVGIAGLDPAISLREAPCLPKRDGRDKPGHDSD